MTDKINPKVFKTVSIIVFTVALLYILWMLFWDVGALYSSYGPGGTAEPDPVSITINVWTLLERILSIILAVLCFRAFDRTLKQEPILPFISIFAKRFGVICIAVDIAEFVFFKALVFTLIKIVNATHPTSFYGTPVISFSLSPMLIFGVVLIALYFVIKLKNKPDSEQIN